MQNLPSVMANNKEAVEQLERDGWDGEEIHHCNGFAMIAQKRQPELSEFRAPGRSPHPTRDGSLRYAEAEHEKFAVDAGRTPGRVLRGHLEDQFTDLFRDSSSSANSLSHLAEHGPVEFESSLVPPNNSLRQDEKERVFPSRP